MALISVTDGMDEYLLELARRAEEEGKKGRDGEHQGARWLLFGAGFLLLRSILMGQRR